MNEKETSEHGYIKPQFPLMTDGRRIMDYLEDRIATEKEKREKNINDLWDSLNNMGTNLDKAFDEIFEALDRLQAPPDKEQSPTLANILERLDQLEKDVDHLLGAGQQRPRA